MLGKNPLSAILAIELYEALIDARRLYLQPAISEAIKKVGVITIDKELHRLVPTQALNHLAQLGLRGELVFPVPSIIKHSPSLLGYYRMLLGFSKKEFLKRGYGAWIKAEENEQLSNFNEQNLEQYCSYLIDYLTTLIDAMNQFEERDLSDLTLLTLGPTLQGGRNTIIGSNAEKQIFQIFQQLVQPWATYSNWPLIRFTSPNQQTFELINKSDPDISLRVGSGTNSTPLLAIEVKGGGDASNAHNRAGEANKSHIKATVVGYHHRWTLIQIPPGKRKQITDETPSSTEIFEFNEIIQQSGSDWIQFKHKFFSLTDTLDENS
jgi:hypothetical protein